MGSSMVADVMDQMAQGLSEVYELSFDGRSC
jgi:hypothetical protein